MPFHVKTRTPRDPRPRKLRRGEGWLAPGRPPLAEGRERSERPEADIGAHGHLVPTGGCWRGRPRSREDGPMAEIENSKLTVVGAGSVGASLAYAALIRGSARHVALYDINAAKAEAEVLDLAHGTQFTGSSTITGGADLGVVEGSNVVVITAGAKQEPGQTRLDLAGTNVRILEKLLPSLLEQAPDATYVLVTNPCDVLTVVAQRISGLPSNRVFSSGTVLDTSRLRGSARPAAPASRTSSVHAVHRGRARRHRVPAVVERLHRNRAAARLGRRLGVRGRRARRDRRRGARRRLRRHPRQGRHELRHRPLRARASSRRCCRTSTPSCP